MNKDQETEREDRENKDKLEKWLDNSTALFFRPVRDVHRLNGYNGTALMMQSHLASGEGAYTGYFGRKDERGNMALINVGMPIAVEEMTFMNAMGHGNGHELRYVKVPEGLKTMPFNPSMGRQERDAWIMENFPRSLDVPIVGRTAEHVARLLREIKEGEFATLRKYAFHDDDFVRQNGGASHIDGVFADSMAMALGDYTPVVPATSGYRIERFLVTSNTSEGLTAARHVSRRDGERPKMWTADRLDSELLKKAEKDSCIDVDEYLNPGTDPNLEGNWMFYGARVPILKRWLIKADIPFSGTEQDKFSV